MSHQNHLFVPFQLKVRAKNKMNSLKDIEVAKCIKAQTLKFPSNCDTKSIQDLERFTQFWHLFATFCLHVKEFNDPCGGTSDIIRG